MAPRSRLTGVDAARGTALLGMAAVHVLPLERADGSPTLVEQVAAGRSAALFAVLAGVGVALWLRGSGGRSAPALVVRALLIGVLGLLLGALDSGVAVILAYYAALFVLALPWLRAGPGVLLASAATIAVAVPFLSRAVRDALPAPDAESPVLSDLADPASLASELLLTGYYPALAWLAYLLTGMAVGRMVLQSPRTAGGLAAAGAGLALAAHGTSALLLGPLGGYDAIARTLRPSEVPGVERLVDAGRFGNVPTSSPWWLATDAPHTTTPLDLAATTGTALLVLGLALLVAPRAGRLAAPLVAVGSLPLTLYAWHVVVLGTSDTGSPLPYYLAQVAGALLFAVLWRRLVGRGPLEELVARAVEPLRRAGAGRAKAAGPVRGRR